MDLKNFCFNQKQTNNYHIIYIDIKLKMSLIINNKATFIILTNKLIDNIIQINSLYIYIF